MVLYEDFDEMNDIVDDNLYTTTAAVSVLVSNDIHYMHFLSKGPDFDKCHLLAQEYYEKLNDEADYLMELALEHNAPICNFTNALSFVPSYIPEDLDYYDYPTIVRCIIAKLEVYVEMLGMLRESTNEPDVQSKLDDMVRDWKKEIDYKLKRRM